MAWGKIYETTWWGIPIINGWGGAYFNLSNGSGGGGISYSEELDFVWEAPTISGSLNRTVQSYGATNYTVDWGDGTIDTNLSGDVTHTYTSSSSNSSINIKMSGDLSNLGGCLYDFRSQISSINSFGTSIEWKALQGGLFNRGALYQAPLITSIPFASLKLAPISEQTGNKVRFDTFARYSTGLTSIDFTGFDSSRVVGFINPFRDANVTSITFDPNQNFSSIGLEGQGFIYLSNYHLSPTAQMTTEQYDSFLLALASTAPLNGIRVTVNCGSVQYSETGAISRATLIANNYNITDGGQI